MRKFTDLTGQRHNKLTITERYWSEKRKKYLWKANCDCGGIKTGIDSGNWKLNSYSNCGCRKTPDLVIGSKFNDWTLLDKDLIGRKRYWCVCVCGNKAWVSKTDLQYNKSKSCMACGHKNSRKPDFQAAFNMVRRVYKRNAKNKNRNWNIDSVFMDMIIRPCHYCNAAPSSCITLSYASFWYNGIDRINNDEGYELDNVVTCCTYCNLAKRGMKYEDFIAWLDQVAKYRSSKL
jgi:hypothetical protein